MFLKIKIFYLYYGKFITKLCIENNNNKDNIRYALYVGITIFLKIKIELNVNSKQCLNLLLFFFLHLYLRLTFERF